MADLKFIYSAMRSGKSLDLLKTAHQYTERGSNVLLFTHEADTRNNPRLDHRVQGVIKTRLGLTADAWLIGRVDVIEMVRNESHCIVLLDEAHFLSEEQVFTLAELADDQNVPVVAYGLKTDFQGNLFPGSEALIRYANSLVELETKCWYCTNKATMNLRVDQNDFPVFSGPQLSPNSSYYPTCRRCYLEIKKKNTM